MRCHVYTQASLKTLGADAQIRRLGRAFEHYFGPRGREFERSNLQKFKCPGFSWGGDIEVSS